MIEEKIKEYRRLYSEYISHAVDLHNHHLSFLNNLGLRTMKDTRRSIRNMISLEKEIHALIWHIYRENQALKREIRKEERREIRKEERRKISEKKAYEKSQKRTYKRKQEPKGKNHGNSESTEGPV